MTSSRVTYTDDDILNSAKFVDGLHLQDLYNMAVLRAPHIASHITIEVKRAENKDFYVPYSLANSAYITTFTMTQKLCERISCNPFKGNGETCTPADEPEFALVGDDSYDVRCQPACFNMRPIPKDPLPNDDDEMPKPQMPRLVWNKGRCWMTSAFGANYMSGTVSRSQARYVNHVNNMETGYSLFIEPDVNYYGETYRINESYCKYFAHTIENEGRADAQCKPTPGERVAAVFFGDRMVQYFMAAVTGNLGNSDTVLEAAKKFNLGTLNIKPHSKQTWLDDIANIRLRDSDGTELIPLKPADRLTKLAKYTETELSHSIDINTQFTKRLVAGRASLKSQDTGKEDDVDIIAPLIEQMMDAACALLESEKFQMLVGQLAVMGGIHMLRNILLGLTKTFARDVVNFIAASGSVLGKNTLLATVTSTIMAHLTEASASFVSRCVTLGLEAAATALSIFNWVLIISIVLDVILNMWDPAGLKQEYPADFPRAFAHGVAEHMRRQYGDNLEFTALQTLRTVLLPEDMTSLFMSSLKYRLMYLDALEVNSLGQNIDKGDMVSLSVSTRAEPIIARAFRYYHWDTATVEAYNKDFDVRTERVNTFQMYAKLALGGAIVMSLFEIPLLALLMMLVSITLFAFSIMSVTNGTLITMSQFIDNVGSLTHQMAIALDRGDEAESATTSNFKVNAQSIAPNALLH